MDLGGHDWCFESHRSDLAQEAVWEEAVDLDPEANPAVCYYHHQGLAGTDENAVEEVDDDDDDDDALARFGIDEARDLFAYEEVCHSRSIDR